MLESKELGAHGMHVVTVATRTICILALNKLDFFRHILHGGKLSQEQARGVTLPRIFTRSHSLFHHANPGEQKQKKKTTLETAIEFGRESISRPGVAPC